MPPRSFLPGWAVDVRRRRTDPVFYAGLTQTVKTSAAAVIAWLVAVHFVGESQAFLAPWAALLTVHATVYRSVSEGLRQVGASVIGVIIAYVFGDLVGFSAATLGLAVLVSLLVGRNRRFGSEGLTVATTALVVLTTGHGDDSDSLETRLLYTGVGIAVGVLVNLLVWPPLGDRFAARHVDALAGRLGALLTRIAGDLRDGYTPETANGWIDRTGDIDQHIDDAWVLVRQAGESTRFNFRRRRIRIQGAGAPALSDVLRRLEQAVAETRSMARSLQRHAADAHAWADDFAQPWTNMLWDVGEAVSAADANTLHGMRWRIDDLSSDLTRHDPGDRHWPLYGALLVNLRNITGALDLVAAAQPIVSPRDRPAEAGARSTRSS